MPDADRAPTSAALPTSGIDGYVSLLYGELHRLASRFMDQQRADHTLQATALVHEACLKLLRADRPFDNRRHFLAVAAKAMRAVLVDHSRTHSAEKRGGGRATVSLPEDDAVAAATDPEAVLELHDALEALAAVDEQLAQLVELRCFGGLTVEESAVVLDISPRRVKRGWAVARAWLRRKLAGGDGEQ